MNSFEINNGKVIMSRPSSYGWLRKEDVLYYLMSTKEIWEEEIKNHREDESMFHDLKGRVLALEMAIDEIKKA